MSSTASRLPLPTKPAFALAAFGGLLYCLGFAGIDLWPCAFVAQAAQMIAIRGQTPKRAAWLGFVNGLVMTTGGFYWLVEMLKAFSGFPLPLCIVFLLVVCAYQGGRIVLMSWLAARAEVRGYPPLFAYGVAFIASELVYPLLFPYYFAVSVHKLPVLLQIADIGGPILAGLVLVGVNIAIAELVIAKLEQRSPDRRWVIGGFAGLLVSVAYGAIRIRMVDSMAASAEIARVGIVQPNMGLMQKRTAIAEGMRRHFEATRDLKARGVDFVVWSESAVQGAVEEDRAEQRLRERVTGQLGLPVIFGAVLVHPAPERENVRLFNTAISTDEKGRITARYDKQYLLMFGEYLPFGETLPILYKWSPNSGHFSMGKTLDPMLVPTKSGTHKASMLICYEDILPAFVRDAVRFADPELLVNITNDAWFGDTTEPWEHLALAKLRAIEQHRYLVRATNSGVSGIVDPVGRVIVQSKTFTQEALEGEIRWMKPTTLYGIFGNLPYYPVLLLSFVMAFRKRFRDAK